MSHFGRERIPERVVHAKGAGNKNFFYLLEKGQKETKLNSKLLKFENKYL